MYSSTDTIIDTVNLEGRCMAQFCSDTVHVYLPTYTREYLLSTKYLARYLLVVPNLQYSEQIQRSHTRSSLRYW